MQCNDLLTNTPGFRMLTRISYGTRYPLNVFARWLTAALLVLYAKLGGLVRRYEATLAVTMIWALVPGTFCLLCPASAFQCTGHQRIHPLI